MAIEDLATKGDLSRFVEGLIQRSDFGQLIRQLQGSKAAGIDSITFTANNDSNTVTVTHGLGTTPTSVVAVAAELVGGAAVINVHAFQYTDTTFDLKGRHTDGTAITQTVAVAWEASV